MTHEPDMLLPVFNDIVSAADRVYPVVRKTPLQFNEYLSQKYQARVFLKREDLQIIRSFKIRGALNKMLQLDDIERTWGVVCASAGNHSQGVAYACNYLGVPGVIYMPENTPQQKIDQVRKYGKECVKVVLTGRNFDECCHEARTFEQRTGSVFVHPFDDFNVICGQGTVALEVLTESVQAIDFLVTPVGGGGLASGVSTVFKTLSPNTRVIGVEPLQAAALYASLQSGANTRLSEIDPFVDGAATQMIGSLGFSICRRYLNDVLRVSESSVCRALIEIYQEQGIVAEPAGCLSIAALDSLQDRIRGRTVVCILSGGNNDFGRFAEITARAAEC
ncbi:threonine dehydratase [Hahella sp. CCB-MM4]|nr:threonine dehydratase [Hahella sp. CCB-MM4]